VLGGFFAQHLSWTVIFWINLPIGGVALYVCERLLRDLPQERRPHRLDLLGSALTIAASLSLMLMLTLGGAHYPWASPPVLALGVAAVALAAWLLRHLARAPEPLLPLDIFANQVVGRAVAALFFTMFAYVGAAVYLPLYFEYRLGLDATVSGAGLIALLGGTVIGSNFAGRRLPRMRHYKRMSYVGLGLSFVALVAMAALARTMSFGVAEALILVFGTGLGPIFPTLTVSVQNAVDPRDLGAATATIAFVRNFGSAIGVAVLGAVIFAYGLQAEGEAAAQAAAAGDAFRAAFSLLALSMLAAIGCFALMEERSLRGPTPTAAALE
jgi:predicted MFS family arabinose efflux permease